MNAGMKRTWASMPNSTLKVAELLEFQGQVVGSATAERAVASENMIQPDEGEIEGQRRFGPPSQQTRAKKVEGADDGADPARSTPCSWDRGVGRGTERQQHGAYPHETLCAPWRMSTPRTPSIGVERDGHGSRKKGSLIRPATRQPHPRPVEQA